MFRTEQHGVGAVNKQATEITVPSFANPTKTRFASGGVLSRHKAEPSGKFSAAAEYIRICNCCCNRSGDDRPYPWDSCQTLADWIVLVPCQYLPLESDDPCLGIFDLVDDDLQHLTGNIRYTPVVLVHNNRN